MLVIVYASDADVEVAACEIGFQKVLDLLCLFRLHLSNGLDGIPASQLANEGQCFAEHQNCRNSGLSKSSSSGEILCCSECSMMISSSTSALSAVIPQTSASMRSGDFERNGT